jgi:HEAT repeat protein
MTPTRKEFIMLWVCPACWHVSGEPATHCAGCGADLDALDGREFDEKLLNALHHPDPDTVMRAADILSQRGEADEVLPALAQAYIEHRREPYVASGIVRAIGRYRGKDSRLLLLEALAHDSIIVRVAAAEALQLRSKAVR